MPLDRRRIGAICFDVDGTLNNTDDQYVARFARWLAPFRSLLPQRDAHRAARRWVMCLEAPGNWLFGLPDRLGIDPLLAAASDWLFRGRERKGHYPVDLIPGARAAIETLSQRYPLAIVTVRSERVTRALLEQSGLGGYFRCVAHGQTTRRAKPYPAPILWVAEELNLSPQAVLMVGDTRPDILAGKAAGAQTLGVLSGFGEKDELLACGADEILPSVAELPGLLA